MRSRARFMPACYHPRRGIQAAMEILRTPLLDAVVGPRSVRSVAVREIRFAPGQRTGRHHHPCPVVGYIVSGTAELEIDGQPPLRLPAGSAFHEPEGALIARFDNASDSEPMTFIACYLLAADEPLIVLR
jgi:quercetin dioxygenase-like cupin family protein